MQGDGLPDDLDLGVTIQIPRFGAGQRIFRRYTLQKIIGRGGMGVVWLAQDAYLESLVALKVLPDTLLHDSASLDSLKRETKMGLSLAHPNIVRIYDFQHDESSAAISMEYVDGGTLSDLRIKKPNKVFNPGDLTDWLGALFDGLDYAHTRKQIVHRDLKPRNLMLNARGELKIADFGISRCISDSVTMLTGIVGSSGTPPYISPQQWDGERPTPLDDIYSLGATLYELLSGKPPLLGVVDWQQVHHRIAPPISQRRIEFGIEGAEPIPQHWEETVAACLAKDPKKRPQTIRELEARLLSDNLESAETLTELPGAPPQETPGPVAESGLPKPIEISGRNTSSGRANISSSPLPTRNPAVPTMQTGEADATSQAKLPAGSSLERPVNDLVAVTPQKAVADKAARTALPGQARWIRMLRDAFSDKRGKIPLLAGLGVAAIFLILLISLPSEKSRDLLISAPSPAAFGDLTVESDPLGATIRLNEGAPLKAPHTYSNLKFGRHKIVASLEGYLTTEKELKFKEGDSSKIILKLAKDPNLPKKPAPPSFATLSVRSTPPGASILVDGSPPDKPPDTFTKLALGKHQLTATLEGYEPIQQELKIDLPNPEPLVIGLKAFGDLSIESEPSGAMIALDEGPPLKAPHTYSNVKFGRHKLSASLEGYLTTQQELELKKGDSQKIVLKLAKKPPSFATLSVRSTPPGASILVDGSPPDKPPDTFAKLALGKHQLTATLEGYEPIQQELKIDVPNPEPLVIGLKAFGDLSIESEPSGAMIALDEGPPLKAPHTYGNVKFGRHKLSASLEGYLTTQQELELKKGDSQEIVLKLAKKPPSFATLSVRSTPPGASILLDGNPPDKPPDTFTKVALGKHQLTATLEGYEPIQQELKIDVPNPEPLVIGLKAFGDLTIESEPSGAMIALDEGPPLKAPHTYGNVKFGRHKLSASLEGYLTTQQELELKKGDSQKIVLKLAKKPPSFATLSVRSTPPGASILLDGNPPDKPPDTFTKLALGKHQLTATLEGYEPIQQELKIDVPNPEPLVIGLKAFGDLTIESEPSGAMIALDEGPPLKAPQTYSNVKFGRHKLSASLEGYLTTQQELELKKGDSQKIVLKLAKKPPSFATLSVRSTPPGASILLDGNPPDKPPDTFTKLALGKHQLTATLEGYEPIQQELKIDVPNPEPLVIGLKAFGNLTIESEPSGAMIALDEGPPLKAPHTYSNVKFGRHKLSASLEGYLTTQQELELKKGDSQKIVLKLAKKPPSFATLSVRSTPPGASILVDGNPPDKPPDTFTKLALGKHQLTATLEGYEPIQQELKIDVPNPEPLVIGLKAFGDLTIESEPSGAMIALDEGPPLKAPHTYSNVKFGRHKLSASLEGYLTTQQELELKKGDSQKIVLKLAKKPPSFATLSVRSTPPGASILLDGNPPDKPPDTFTKLALGKHQLTATLEGYEPLQQELQIDVPNPEPLVIGLKAFGNLTIESEPSGAMIALDEGPPLKAPHTYSNVKFGRHKLSASLEGYLTTQQELELKKGDSQEIVLKLAKKPPSFATLSVRSTPPGASILLDGNPPDKPPDTFTKVALGKHQLTATLEGYEPIQQELKIDVPNPEPLVIGLKAFGDLAIESEPSGAMIALDEGPPLKAPQTYSNVKFGRHKLSASLEGYLTTQQELELKKGDSQKIVLKLAKKPPSFATLSVRSTPPGASILLDGNPPDKPPDTFTKLALGKHQLTATLEGYEPIQQELKIDVPNPEPLVIGLKAFGDLTIESEPSGAMIALDEGPPLKAPHTYSNVKFGPHKLSASLEGYLTTQQELELRKGDSQKIVLKLAKKPPSFAKLSVRSDPPGASILVDGNAPDEPPDTFTKLALGKHQLTATLENYESIQRELKIDTANPDPLIIPLKHTQSFIRLQELVDQINSSKTAPDSPQYLNACVKYLQHLYLTPSPPSPEVPPEELKQDLEKIIERLRDHQALLKPSVSRQEFQKYEDPVRIAAQLGSTQALLMLAENEKEPSKKFRSFQDAALVKNNPDAMMMLGILSAKGVGEAAAKPNFEKALDWLKRASDAGNREAAAYYYDCFLFGDATKKRSEDDQKAAVESLEVLAKQGIAHAAVVLGEWYRRRASIAGDNATRLEFYREADDWWKMAKGPREWRVCFYLGALREMGSINDDGKPTEADLKEAKALYEEGASNEDVMCMFQLGRFIWDRSGASRNSDQKREALRYIKNAAAAGSEPAKTWLAKHENAR